MQPRRENLNSEPSIWEVVKSIQGRIQRGEKEKFNMSLNMGLNLLIPIIHKIVSDDPNITLEELEDTVFHWFSNFSNQTSETIAVYSAYMSYASYEYLKDNEKAAKKVENNSGLNLDLSRYLNNTSKRMQDILQKLEENNIKNRNSEYFKKNAGKFETYLMKQMLILKEKREKKVSRYVQIPKFEESYSKFAWNERNVQKLIKEMTTKGELKKNIKYTLEVIAIYKGNLNLILEEDRISVSKYLKEKLISSIIKIWEDLNKIGIMEFAKDKNLENFKKMDFIEWAEAENGFDKVDKTELEQLSISALLSLYTFWLNRCVKFMEDLANAIYCVEDLGLLEEIKENCGRPKYKPYIRDNQMNDMLLKKLFWMERYNKFFYESVEGIKINKPIHITVDDNGKKRLDMIALIEKVGKWGGRDYVEIFNKLSPVVLWGAEKKKNITKEEMLKYIAEDVVLISGLFNGQQNGYLRKTEMTKAFLLNVLTNSSRENAGIIVEEKNIDKNGRVNFNSKFVGVGKDCCGELNSPVEVHMVLDDLKEFVKEFTGESIIKVYKRHKALEKISTAEIFPISSKQKKAVREKSEKCRKTGKIIECLEAFKYLCNSKKKPSYFEPDMYLNLETGEFVRRNKDGEWEPVERGANGLETK